MSCPPLLRLIVDGRTVPLEASGMSWFRLLAVPEIIAADATPHQPLRPATTTERTIDFMML
jgi:hypothetical protein